MDDKSIHAESPHKDEGQNSANDASPQGAANDIPEEGNLDILIDIVEIVAGLIFGVISYELSDAGFHIWSFLFGLLAIECAIGVICHRAGKTKFKKFVRRIFIILTILNIAFFAFLTWHVLNESETSAHSPAAAPIVDTKQEIRTLLEQINPQILPLIDAGANRVFVLIGDSHANKLRDFAETQNGRNYFSLQKTTVFIMGGTGNTIDNYLQDQDNATILNGYEILPKDALIRTTAITTEPAYIPGTQFTHAQMEYIFPFGYTVFSTSEQKRWKYEVFKTGLTEWSLDWENVKIEPDFGRGSVTWTIPKIVADGGSKPFVHANP